MGAIGNNWYVLFSLSCRFLLLATIPVLIASLVLLVVANLLNIGTVGHAVLSTVGVFAYLCLFVTGFGPIPNILCAEIFPTQVRGVCIAICSLANCCGSIIITYTLPMMLDTIGLTGVCGIYATVCILSLLFVFSKVPETKGMPLEVISEFFAVGTKQAARNWLPRYCSGSIIVSEFPGHVLG